MHARFLWEPLGSLLGQRAADLVSEDSSEMPLRSRRITQEYHSDGAGPLCSQFVCSTSGSGYGVKGAPCSTRIGVFAF